MSITSLLLTGGAEKSSSKNEWTGFQSALALVCDVKTGDCKEAINYFTPEEFRPPMPDCSVLFKSAEIQQGMLVATTQTEVLLYDIKTYQLKSRISLPCFNDVHHARLTESGSLLVCATGLDAVFELDLEGNVLKEYPVLGQDIWHKFSKEQDYRQVLTTKPHESHPNFCFEYQGEYFVTRFKQKDAISLATDKAFDIAVGGPHDGYVLEDEVYFTTVNGFVVGFNITSGEKVLECDLNQIENPQKKNLGWCRSLLMLNKDEAIVGFSRMRTSKFSDYLSWVKEKTGAGTANAEPTRIVKYNFKNSSIDWSVNIECFNINAVFSVLDNSENI
ncbi:hypothetical protein [Thalassotalea hakodatensis]|uniref:hypothetical protein n=1 Tax=Thalassotalea hakodatensis TaxID=3030492 RepID=UPI002574254F|nr:hypothetical protein [Thalassotalea hakodatensis]